MSFIIYGVKERPIGVDEVMVKCPSCEQDSWADIMVTSKYFHFYMLPIFPTEKDLNIVCQRCGLKRYNLAFEERYISNFKEIKGKFRHHWSLYAGTILAGLIILSIIVTEVTKHAHS